MPRKSPKKSLSPVVMKGMSKAAFVRSFARTTPAKEVVAKAKSQGIHLTDAYVYNVRATSKHGAKSKAGKRAAPTAKKARGLSAEDRLRAVAAELGIARAIAVLKTEQARMLKLKGRRRPR